MRALPLDLPGSELVSVGLQDLAGGVESVEALLVSIGEPRLRDLGLDVPEPLPDPEHRLYERLATDDPDRAHSRYNSLVRRLVSFERAAACVV
ncbi:MAG: hypothetical protein ACR2G7_01190 [Acidimicrobiales bacterium]